MLIRGVDHRAYKELSSFAKKLGVNVGYLASQSFKLLVALLDSSQQLAGFESTIPEVLGKIIPKKFLKTKPVFIRHVGRLVVSAKDLENAPGPLVFFGIKELEFDPSVDEDIFEKKVLKIVDCEKVMIHRHLDKIKVLSKSLFIGEIVERI